MKLKYDKLLSNFAFNCSLRPHTKVEAIDSLIRKAGYGGSITDTLRCSLRTTRYQSTACTATYPEYFHARQLQL